ncbi:MAG TPA: AI-2E family transporter [Thermoanaerobaculia bacterium]|jgi:predicted PurR-regulated permease PerM
MAYPVRPERSGELALFTRKVAVVAAVCITLGIFWLVRDILLLVFIAAVLAAGIAPAVRRVRAMYRYWFRRRLPRGTAVMIVYLPFLIGVLMVSLLIIPRLISETSALAQHLPALIEQNILKPMERHIPVGMIRDQLNNGVEMPRARVFLYVRSAGRAVASVMAILFMIAYMLIDAERLRNLMLLIYPPEVRGERRRTMTRMGKRMSSWLSGQLLLSLIIGVSTFVGLLLLRVPYALPLAILAAIGELVPVLGPTVGAIPALAIALLHSPWQFWSVLVFAIVLQKVENLFIVPRVMSSKVSVSPLAIFIAFMMGASLLGIVGAILAVPLAAILQVTFEEAFVRRRERRQDVDRAGTLLRRVD